MAVAKRVFFINFLIAGCLLLFTISVFSATIRVPADQPTIQAGIDAASSLDTVLVQPGTYEELLNFNGKSVYLLGEFGVDSTILTYPVRCPSLIVLHNGEDTLAVIDGFRVENVSHDFAVIDIISSSVKIRNCVFISNTNFKPSPSSWGVIGMFNGGILIVEDCYFEDNHSYSVAGIGIATGSGRLQRNTFVANNAFGDFGGAIGTGKANLLIEWNLFVNNHAPQGGAIFLSEDNASIVRNNTFVGNTSGNGGAIFLWVRGSGTTIEKNIVVNNTGYGITNQYGSTASFDFNNAYNNFPSDYAGDISQGANSISADPLFCDTLISNFFLQDLSPSAPLFNNGVLVGAYDVGCFCCQGTAGDFNGDGDNANIIDLTFLVDFIFRGSGDPGPCPSESDVNGDGNPGNILDLTYLLDYIFRGGTAPPACP